MCYMEKRKKIKRRHHSTSRCWNLFNPSPSSSSHTLNFLREPRERRVDGEHALFSLWRKEIVILLFQGEFNSNQHMSIDVVIPNYWNTTTPLPLTHFSSILSINSSSTAVSILDTNVIVSNHDWEELQAKQSLILMHFTSQHHQICDFFRTDCAQNQKRITKYVMKSSRNISATGLYLYHTSGVFKFAPFAYLRKIRNGQYNNS